MNAIKERKRYGTEQEILDAIDRARLRAATLLTEAAEFDRLKLDAARNASGMEQTGGDEASAQFWRDQMNEYKRKAEGRRVTYNGIMSRELKFLGEKLAELRTEPMNFLAGDSSVQV